MALLGERKLATISGTLGCGGTGSWRDTLITVDTLSTGFDRLQYGLVKVDAPRLILTKPLTWQRDNHHPAFIAGLKLSAKKWSSVMVAVISPVSVITAIQWPRSR